MGKHSNGNPVDALDKAAPWMRLSGFACGGRTTARGQFILLAEGITADRAALEYLNQGHTPMTVRIPVGHAAFVYPVPPEASPE